MEIAATSPVHFHFRRGGGAIIGAHVSIWSGVGGPSPKLEAVAAFDDPVPSSADRSEVLAAGHGYTCVLDVFVRKGLNGRYRFGLEVDGHAIFAADAEGDVSDEPLKAALLSTQFDVAVRA